MGRHSKEKKAELARLAAEQAGQAAPSVKQTLNSGFKQESLSLPAETVTTSEPTANDPVLSPATPAFSNGTEFSGCAASAPAAAVTPHNLKVISFSLYGRHPMYVNGAIENAKHMREFYPGWQLWYHVGKSAHPSTISRLEAQGASVILMDDTNMPPWGGKYWRMLPLTDGAVDVCIIRDVDSRPSAREAAAVNEWLASGLPFHSMRDHKLHTSPIMGGMWGARRGFVEDFKRLFDEWISGLRSGANRNLRWCKGGVSDQGFLGNVIWPLVSDKCVVHDDWKRFSGKEVEFKTKPAAAGLFVGQVYDQNSHPVFKY